MTGLESLGQFKTYSVSERARFQATFHCFPFFWSSDISVFPGIHRSITNIIRLKFTFKTFWHHSDLLLSVGQISWSFVSRKFRGLHAHTLKAKPNHLKFISVGPIFLSEKGGVKSSRPKTLYKIKSINEMLSENVSKAKEVIPCAPLGMGSGPSFEILQGEEYRKEHSVTFCFSKGKVSCPLF